MNAADTRLMVISFNGVTPLILAVDGQPCEVFEPVRQTIPLGPGARFDVMFDLPADAGADANVTLLGDNEPDRILLKFKTAGDKRPPLPPVASFVQNPLLPREIKLQAARKARYCDRCGEPYRRGVKSSHRVEAQRRCVQRVCHQRRCFRSSVGRR